MIYRYLLFSGEDYYPLGGWSDFVRDFDTPEEAMGYRVPSSRGSDWAHIVDTEDGDIIYERGSPGGWRRPD